VTAFHLPLLDLDPAEVESTYARLAEAAGCPLPDRRVESITYVHDGVDWTATVGRTLRGVKVSRRRRQGRTVEVKEQTSDPATVVAILPGAPWMVWTSKAPLGPDRSGWVNPFMAGGPTSVTYFDSPAEVAPLKNLRPRAPAAAVAGALARWRAGALALTMGLAVVERDAPVALGVSAVLAATVLLRDFRPTKAVVKAGGVEVELERVEREVSAVAGELVTTLELHQPVVDARDSQLTTMVPSGDRIPDPSDGEVRSLIERLMSASARWGYLQGASGFWAAPPTPHIVWRDGEPEILFGEGDTARRRSGQSSEASR
jgi:hypothetical protein